MKNKLPVSEIKTIAILRALQLGDLLCSIPAIRTLRHAFPNAKITLLGLPWAERLLMIFPNYFDEFIHFPGYEGLPEQPYREKEFIEFKQLMQQKHFDLLLQMQGNGNVVNNFIFGLGAKYVAGFYNENARIHDALFMPYPNKENEVIRHLKLMEHLGLETMGTQMEFTITPHDDEQVKDLLLPLQENSYICLHPGSRGAWRQWPPVLFAALADICIEKGFTVVVTGTNDEIAITQEVIKCMKYKPIDLTGKTSMGAMASLLKNAFLLISNCTGVSHIAAATQTPSIVISMDGEPYRWAPLNNQIHKMIDWKTNPAFEEVLNTLMGFFEKKNHSSC